MERKLVALSFDDGPSNVTEKVLDILEENGVVATFFLIGEQVKPEVKSTLERQLKLGCELANHSWTHSQMNEMTPEEINKEIDDTTKVIKEIAGVDVKFFRPPYIALSDTMYDTIKFPFICGVDSRDWDAPVTTQERIDNVVNAAADGNIYLMHDFNDNVKTLEALPVIIKELKAKGYEFATMSQIFEEKGIDPNVHHRLWSNVFQKDNG